MPVFDVWIRISLQDRFYLVELDKVGRTYETDGVAFESEGETQADGEDDQEDDHAETRHAELVSSRARIRCPYAKVEENDGDFGDAHDPHVEELSNPEQV